jgi:hypothetical protein
MGMLQDTREVDTDVRNHRTDGGFEAVLGEEVKKLFFGFFPFFPVQVVEYVVEL